MPFKVDGPIFSAYVFVLNWTILLWSLVLLASLDGDCGREDTLEEGLKPLPRNGDTLPDGLVALD